jgi:5-methylcytosine-specific restriction protein B
VLYAVAIVDGKTLEDVKAEKYDNVFKRYLKHKDDGLIAFTTFHQSFGYEEFIEGIRPVVISDDNPESGRDIEYEVRDGIFKVFCDTAIHGAMLSNDQLFDKAWEDLVSEARNNGEKYDFTRINTGSHFSAEVVNNDKFRVSWRTEQGSHNDINKEAVRKQWLTDINRDTLSGGSRWLFDAKQAVIDELEKRFQLHYSVQGTPKNRVFIIDEINRGNISKIFGELITLIEPTKRIGAPEGLRALLPYSGQNFGIPDNVYIIGTMNTADRSIAMIDTALRRRFSFVEMPPDSDLLRDIVVGGIDIAEMLDTMNRRITVLLDREHTIGHSYLLPLKDNSSVKKLAEIFEYKIIPLLQEYFYDDYEKIQLVLGDNQKNDDNISFVVKKNDAIKLFGSAGIDYPEFYEVNREAFDRIEAYAFLS